LSMAAATILQIRKLHYGYPNLPLFTDWSCDIPAGVTLLQGGESRGKTTLLQLLAGDMKPQAGTVQFRANTAHHTAKASAPSVFRTVPRSEAHEQVTPAQFLVVLQESYGSLDLNLAKEIASGLSLTAHLEKPMFMLSAGSRRKVWLTAAFAAGATVTLLDEPFAALDRASIDFVLQLLSEAATHVDRAWVVADYTAPHQVPLSHIIDLGD